MSDAAAIGRVRSAKAFWLLARSMPAPAALPLLLLVALWLAFFHGLGNFPLFDVDEGAFGEATREMLQRGDFVTTWLNGEPRFDKPILTYWLQALSVSMLGLNEFALRLPSALAAVAWVGAILVFTGQQTERATAYAAALIAATSLALCVIGRGAIADALLNLFLVLAMFDIYRYLEQPLPHVRYRAYLWMALGLLTKGPVALLIPAAASAPAFWLHGKWRAWGRAALDPGGWLIVALVAGPWYLLEYQRQGDAFFAGFFLRHNVERFLSPLQGHRGNALYYVPAALILLLPYTGLFLRVLPSVRRLRVNPLDTFLWCWFLFVLLFFSLAGTKLPHYLIYGLTPLFILMARERRRLDSWTLAMGPPVLLLLAAVALPYALQWLAPSIRNAWAREALTRLDIFGAAYQRGTLWLLFGVLVLAVLPRLELWQRLIGSGLLCAIAVGGFLLPAVAELQQGPVKEAALYARQQGWQVRTWQFNVPSASVYRDAITPRARVPRPGEVLLTRSSEIASIGPAEVLYRKGGVLLVRVLPRG